MSTAPTTPKPLRLSRQHKSSPRPFTTPPQSPIVDDGQFASVQSSAASTKSASSTATYHTAPSSPTTSRSTSPQHGSRLMRKFNSRWTSKRDELDFGCAGEAVHAETEDIGDRWYCTYNVANRSSTASSSIPSLCHSRGHSSSSEHSASTAESSLPPSPKSSSEATLSPALSPLPYTSRVPLTPRSAQRKRQSDEIAAVEALDHFFSSARLSRVDEDVASTGPPAVVDRVKRAEALLSANHINQPPKRQPLDLQISIADEHDFESVFAPLGDSTFAPLAGLECHSPATSDSHLSSSTESATLASYRGSPVPDADMSGALDELSAYFTSTSRVDAVPRAQTATPPPVVVSNTTLRSPINLSQRSSKRPIRAQAPGGVKIGLTAPVVERRIHYEWI